MKDVKEAFGKRLKEIRKNKDMTQEALAEKLELSPRQLIRIEKGENFPSAKTVEKISLILGISLDNLFNFHSNNETITLSDDINQINPHLKVVRKGEFVIVKSLSHQIGFTNRPLKVSEFKKELFSLCKSLNNPVIIDIFDNKKRIGIKKYYPDNTVEELLSYNDILKMDNYNYILKKIKKISYDLNKLNYLKLAVDSIDNQKALEKLSIVIQGMKLMH